MTVHKYSPTRARGISEFSTGHGIVAVIAVLAAVMLGVRQRPKSTRPRCLIWGRTEQSRSDPEQDLPAPSYSLRLRLAPRERVQQWQPGIFELRQLLPGHVARQELRCDRLQARLGRDVGR